MNSAADPPFSSVAIVGLGLIGGSIALGIRERWPAARITGIDRQAVLAHALGSGAIYRGTDRLDGLGEPDLVILAAPVRQNVLILRDVAQRLPSTTVITDVGGTKRDIVAAASGLPLAASFVGGHPIGGAERGGFGFARPDLFKSRPWIFTPAALDAGNEGPPAGTALHRLFAFVAALGAKPFTMTADEHDSTMAFLSHLPQLAASALMDVIGTATGPGGLRLAGRGLVDTTRLASSPPDTWRDICAANADAVGAALDRLIARLTELRGGLENGSTVDRVFENAARWRAELMKERE